jgi:DNA-binding winged helix-turn-helix (wHTH) protein
MAAPDQTVRLQFESFELDLRTRELRKEGRAVRLQDQPLRLLALLAGRPGVLVTRAEIEKELWGEDTVVEFEHSINTAMRKIREALGDDLEKPRFVETLPRKGYRFIAPVQSVRASGEVLDSAIDSPIASGSPAGSLRDKIPLRGQPADITRSHLQAEQAPSTANSGVTPGPKEEFAVSRGAARPLFLLIQVGFLAMYCAALYKAEAIEGVLGRLLGSAAVVTPAILVLAMCGIAVRLYLISAVGLDHPEAGVRFKRLFPALFILDVLWSASPLLLTGTMGIGLALGSVAALAYLPFAQRTLMLSAYPGGEPRKTAATELRTMGTWERVSTKDDRSTS